MRARQPLGEIAEIVRGISFPKDAKSLEPRSGDVACLRTTNVQRDVEWDDLWFVPTEHVKRAEQFVQPGDILISTANSYEQVGKVAAVTAVPRQATLGAFISLIRPRAGVEPKFLYHQLAWGRTRSRIRETASTTTNISNVSTKKLAALELDVPPLDEQRRIVAEIEKQFSRLDQAVANLKRVKANLKRQTVAILSAAIGGELLDRAVLLASTERPDFAPVIDLPCGWSWVSAADVCEVVASGSTPKPEEMTSGAGEVPFIKVYNLGFDGSLDFTVKPTFIRRAIHDRQLARSRCLPGDVLMNIVGPPLGKVSLVPDSFPEWNINQAIVTFRVGPRILNRLLAYWLMAPPVQRRIERTSKATAGQYNVQVSTCRKLVLPLPPLGEQARIVAEVDRRLSITREVEAEIDANLKRAQALRQAVLVRAFGIRVPL